MSYKKRARSYGLRILILFILVIFFSIFAITQGSVEIPASNVVKIIMGEAAETAIKPSHIFIVQTVRLPRILLSAMVGGLLAVVGAAFQAIFKNPMADPYVMGVSSGAAFGATIGILFGIGMSFMGIGAISLMAFIGALSTMLLVYSLALVGRKISTTSILLAGVVVNALLSSVISFLMLMNHNKIDQIVTWTMGSFNAASWQHVMFIALPAFLGAVYLMFHAREYNALLLGEEDAQNIGVNVSSVKKRTLVLASLLSALSVAVSGIIGFVGLIVPHVFRMIFGPDHRILLPASFLGGALFMTMCDTLARSLLENMEIPVGIITSIFGGPFFLFLLLKHKKDMV